MPAYEALQSQESLGRRMLEIVMAGVSAREYAGVIGEMAGTVGVSKFSVSREVVAATEAERAEERERASCQAKKLSSAAVCSVRAWEAR